MTMTTDRLRSLDQFRGSAVLGMFIVNFVGGFAVTPTGLKHHHTYCSYADVVMPQFLFAVGLAYRLTFVRRQQQQGTGSAVRTALWRGLGLVLIGIVLYHLTGRYDRWENLAGASLYELTIGSIKRGPFEALTHIGVTCLWLLPVIGQSAWVRILYALFSGALHVALSLSWYYDWNLSPPFGIDGGPLGFLTWAIPALAGTLAYDLLAVRRWELPGLLLIATSTMTLGLGLMAWGNPAAAYPFAKGASDAPLNYWTMSQRSGSITYLLFATGVVTAMFLGFRKICDGWGVRWGYLELFGRNALGGYIVHILVMGAVKPYTPKDSPGWYVLLAVVVYLGILTVVLRYLDRNKLHFRL